jgi:hypothetical protein
MQVAMVAAGFSPNARADAAVGYHPVCTSEARKIGDTAAAERSRATPCHAPGAGPLSFSNASRADGVQRGDGNADHTEAESCSRLRQRS